ncbi:pyruvate, water dikinase regulatory protein [Sulfidibacter corallicola]|nr:pyruvate, water dikinase regulatory protein [Sulfidibacter corallicola]
MFDPDPSERTESDEKQHVNHYIYVVSDGTGETAGNMVRSLITQFSNVQGIFIRKYPKVTNFSAVDRILKNAVQSVNPVMVIYTLVDHKVKDYLRQRLQDAGVPGYDLFTSLLSQLSTFLGARPQESPDLFHGVNEKYFKRMEAIEFTLRHDDGRLVKDLGEADIVLVGVSRAGKTPLSIYLSLYGHKVVNIPLAKGVKPPSELETVSQKKIVGLTINPERLMEIRKKRLTGMKVGQSEYYDPQAILEELEEANTLFRKNRRWPIIDVTNRSIEEIAGLVRDKVFGRDRRVN